MMDYDNKDLELFNYTNFNSLSFEGRKIYYYFYNEFNPFTVIDFIQDEENIWYRMKFLKEKLKT